MFTAVWPAGNPSPSLELCSSSVNRALVSVGAFTLLAGSCSCPHLIGEEMRFRRPSDSGELGSEPTSSVEVVLDDYAPHAFKLLGHSALPVITHDQDSLMSPLSFVRTGKVGFRPLSFPLFSFPSYSQFPAASERPSLHLSSVGDLLFSLHSMFNKQLFIQQKYIRHLRCTLWWVLETQLPTK